MTAGYDLLGLTNALTDLIIPVSDQELAQWKLAKAQWNVGAAIEYERFVEIVTPRVVARVPAGSPANTIIGAAALGVRSKLLGSVGDDDAGKAYEQYMFKRHVGPLLERDVGPSGIAYVLITPDKERTSIVRMGLAGRHDYDLSRAGNPRIFHTSGYELATNPVRVVDAVDWFHKRGTLISYDLASPRSVAAHRFDAEGIASKASVLFASIEEAQALSEASEERDLLDFLRSRSPLVVLKKGAGGSVVFDGTDAHAIPAYPVKLVNTCGAGDAYAAGFLSGYLRGYSPLEAGHLGSYIASRVCSIEESHFSGN